MDMEIYYFSGTGNSLFVARKIAEKTGGTLISIPSMMERESIESNTDSIGIVFPIYYATNDSGLPLIIGRFVGKLKNIGQKYIFAVCTCGYMPGTTIENLGKAIESRGGELAAGFTVKMSSKKLVEEKQRRIDSECEEKLDVICEAIGARRRGKYETRSRLGKLIFVPLLYLFIRPAFSRRYRKLSNLSRLPSASLYPSQTEASTTMKNVMGVEFAQESAP
jgi:flavodoxin